MSNDEIELTLSANVNLLAVQSEDERKMSPCCGTGAFPSVPALKEMIGLVKGVVFPNFLERRRTSAQMRVYYIGEGVERIFSILSKEILHALCFEQELSE